MTNLAFNYSEEPAILTDSYIDTDDLKEVLESYFANELDDCTSYMDRLYKEPNQLHPTNTLWGQVDSDTIKSLINKLPQANRAALNFHYGQSPELNGSLLYSLFCREQNKESLDSWIQMTFIEALELISYELLDIL